MSGQVRIHVREKKTYEVMPVMPVLPVKARKRRQVPEYIQKKLEALLRSYSGMGIPCAELFEAYYRIYNRHLHHTWVGFQSILELCQSLPHIVQCIPDSNNEYHLYAVGIRVEEELSSTNPFRILQCTSESYSAPDCTQSTWRNPFLYDLEEEDVTPLLRDDSEEEEETTLPRGDLEEDEATTLPRGDSEEEEKTILPCGDSQEEEKTILRGDSEEEEKTILPRGDSEEEEATTLPLGDSEIPNVTQPEPAASGGLENPWAALDATVDCIKNLLTRPDNKPLR